VERTGNSAHSRVAPGVLDSLFYPAPPPERQSGRDIELEAEP
jgi:hypothetical protein